jgi:nucleotide-binding universal stress UspA family protein
MMRTRVAYLPLTTYPEAVPDDAILAAIGWSACLAPALNVSTFAVKIPQITSPMGRLFLDIPGMVRAAEDRSKAECHRLQELVRNAAGANLQVRCTTREVILSGELDTAAAEARLADISIVPWSGEHVASHDMAQALVFGSGRPALLVPPSTRPAPLDHVAVGWDASRVAARALGDVLPLLAENGQVTVLTIRDEKPLSGADPAGSIVSALEKRGYKAKAMEATLSGRTIAAALQDSALQAGAQLLAMGGFGHSRIRDFVLGGATEGILAQLRLPALLSH